jgi:hypothetical protein
MQTTLYTDSQIRNAAWYVSSYKSAIIKAQQGIKIRMDWACVGLDEAGLRKAFVSALFNRIDTKAGVKRVGRKFDPMYQTGLMRDARALRDIKRRIRVYQFETPEIRARFSHLLSSRND